MNNPISIIAFYSKYSPVCKNLLSLYDPSKTFIRFVCIDNKSVRAKFTQSSNFRLSSVPCILMTYENGECEKFEGPNVSVWLESQLSALLPKPDPEFEPEPILSSPPNTTLIEPDDEPKPQFVNPKQAQKLIDERQTTLIQQMPSPEQQEIVQVQRTPNKVDVSHIMAQMGDARKDADMPPHVKAMQARQSPQQLEGVGQTSISDI